MHKRVAVTFIAAMLSGCGGTGDTASNTSVLGASFDNGFRTTFRTKFVEQCVAGAKTTSGAGVDFTPVCACSADKLLASKSATQLMTGPSNEEVRKTVVACASEHPFHKS